MAEGIMADNFLWALGSVIGVSLISFVGVLSLAIREKALHKILSYLVSFAAGTMIAVAFLDLFPEALANGGSADSVALYALVGIVVFFVLERFLYWYHCHGGKCESHGVLGPLVLVGDGLHNFLDGLIIGATFIFSVPLGLVTALAVIFHEIPQELGDFGALVYSGMSRGKALFYNFLSGLTAVIGTVVAFIAATEVANFASVLVPLAAGGFIFIGTRMMFDLHHEPRVGRSFAQLGFLILGILLMAWISAAFHA